MNLENVMQSERSQSRKHKYCLTPLIGGLPRSAGFIQTGRRMLGVSSRGREWGVSAFIRDRVSVLQNEQVLGMAGGDINVNHVNVLNVTELNTKKW